MKKLHYIIFVVGVIIFVLGGVLYWFITPHTSQNIHTLSPQSTPSVVTPTDQSGAPNWQIYENKTFGYSIAYPSDWTFRQFPDTQSGAGFRPLQSSNDVASECITIDERSAPARDIMMPLDAYARIAGRMEIQGYETLHTITSVTTTAGLVGYETTWLYKTMTGQENISLPITYIENNKTIQMSNGPIQYKTLQIILQSDACKEVYDRMLYTVKLLP